MLHVHPSDLLDALFYRLKTRLPGGVSPESVVRFIHTERPALEQSLGRLRGVDRRAQRAGDIIERLNLRDGRTLLQLDDVLYGRGDTTRIVDLILDNPSLIRNGVLGDQIDAGRLSNLPSHWATAFVMTPEEVETRIERSLLELIDLNVQIARDPAPELLRRRDRLENLLIRESEALERDTPVFSRSANPDDHSDGYIWRLANTGKMWAKRELDRREEAKYQTLRRLSDAQLLDLAEHSDYDTSVTFLEGAYRRAFADRGVNWRDRNTWPSLAGR